MERHIIVRERVKGILSGAGSLAHLLPEGGILGRSEYDSARSATKVWLALSKGRAIAVSVPDDPTPNVSVAVWRSGFEWAAHPAASPAHAKMVLPNPMVDKSGFISALEGVDGFEATPPALTRSAWVKAHGHVPRCPTCAKLPMQLKTPKGGEPFWSCTGYPACKGAIDTFPFDTGALKGTRALAPKCPSCARPMRKRDGSKGSFWACTGFPDCNRSVDAKVGDRAMTNINDWLPEEGAPAPAPEPVDPLGGDKPPPPRGAPLPLPAKPAPVPSPSPAPTPEVEPEASPPATATVDDIRARFRAS